MMYSGGYFPPPPLLPPPPPYPPYSYAPGLLPAVLGPPGTYYPPLPPPPCQQYFGNPGPPPRRGRGGWRGKKSFRVYNCDSCNREYKTEETYQAHVAQHVKCDGCDLQALPKIIQEHSMIHSLPDFLKVTSKEEIEKWRANRRKNYPTASNIARKKQDEVCRKDSGRVLDTPLYRYVNNLIRDYEGSGRGRFRRGQGRPFRGRGRGRRGWGFQHQERGHHDGTSESSCSNQESEVSQKNTDDDKDPSSSNDSHSNEPRVFRGRGRRYGYHGNERKRKLQDENESSNQPKKKNKKWLYLNDVIPKKPTLLEKLLAPEIRQERNTVLQCVRYIVKENFFQSVSNGGSLPPANASRTMKSASDNGVDKTNDVSEVGKAICIADSSDTNDPCIVEKVDGSITTSHSGSDTSTTDTNDTADTECNTDMKPSVTEHGVNTSTL